MATIIVIAATVFVVAVLERVTAERDIAARPRRIPLWCTLAFCAIVLVSRRPDMVVHPQFWAEDAYFFERAYTIGWRALFVPYAGYFHTIPRLVGLLAVHCDPAFAPGLFVGAAAALTLYVAARTQSRRSPFSGFVWSALAVVMIPDAFEILLTIVNLQWILAGGLFLLLVAQDAETTAQKIHDLSVAVLLSLTGPFSVIFASLFAIRAWRRRSRASTWLAAIVGTCAAIQAWSIVTHPLPRETGAIQPRFLLADTGTRIFGSLTFGRWLPADLSLTAATMMGVVTLMAVALLAARPGPQRVERTLVGFGFFGLLASSLYRCRFSLPALENPPFGARYFFPLQLAVVWLVIHALGAQRRSIAIASAMFLVITFVANLPRLRERALVDQHWADAVPKIRAGEAVVVPINPPGWTMALPPRPTRRPRP